jgi:hypothetical protein
VVHVVWNAPEENLHDSIILDQIQSLNEDYNLLNEDKVNLRSVFQPEAGNANIQFELEEIIRTETDVLFDVDIFGTNLIPEVKHTEQGGSDAWDTDAYLNIWITKIQPLVIFGMEAGQILGFAFPPAGLENWPDGVSAPVPEEDGVVLDYRVIGRNNPNTVLIPDGSGDLLTVRGRSATHEVGHYLGLRHIWGDGSLFGPNDCNQSDGIDDTPFADAQSAFDCDKSKNSCSQVESHYNENMPDLVENFMDYARDDCMNMFTNGQSQHMRNVLFGPRIGLIEKTSVADISDLQNINVFPNPASDQINIAVTVAQNTFARISITDAHGRVVKAWTENYYTGENRASIDSKDIVPGMYFLQVKTDEEVVVKRVMVK